MEINKIHNTDFRLFIKSIIDGSIDLIVTDPPYKMTSRGATGTTGGMLKKKIVNSGSVFQHNDIKPEEYIPEFYRVLKADAHCYIMTNHVNLQDILNVAIESGFKFVKSLIWDKGNKIMGTYYMSQFEYILFFRKGADKKINNCGTSDILRVPNKKMCNSDEGGNLHDTEKPIQLMKILIENSSDVGDLVFEPFAGIGSTILACIETDRNYIGCEIDEKYFNIIHQRINITKEMKPLGNQTLFGNEI